MRIRQLNHSVYQVQYHIVWATKYRRKVLKHYVRAELIRLLFALQRQRPDWYFVKINTGNDHIHLLLELPPKYSVADAVKQMKIFTSIGLRKKFKFMDRIFNKGRIWSVGYFVSTVGLNEDQIAKYIELQNRYDRSIDVSGEFS